MSETPVSEAGLGEARGCHLCAELVLQERRLCPGHFLLALTRALRCRVVPAGSWRLSKAVSCRNSCLKEPAARTALGKWAPVPAAAFPGGSPCPGTQAGPGVSLSWRGEWGLANAACATGK